MAKPSDLLGEIQEVAEAADLGPSRGPVYRSIDDKRRTKDSARRMEALSLRLAGLTYSQIGDRLGISEDGARDMVVRTLARAENRAVDEQRSVENARLDRAQAAIWTQVLEGDLRAVDTFLRLSQRRARMNGLDAPLAVNLSIGIRQDMEAALSTLEKIVLGEVIDSHDSPIPPALEQG